LGFYSNPPFVNDKYGQIVFFPWSIRGKGYLVSDSKTEKRLKVISSVFIRASILLAFLVPISSLFLLSMQGGFFLCIGTLLGVPINWVVLYFLIVDAFTKDLSVYPLSYKELILDNISSYDDDPFED